MSHFLYSRHFVCLTCLSVLAGLTAHLPLASNVPLSFALYGGLHALALVVTLRAPQTLWRMVIFVGIAAAISVLTLRAGLIALQLLGSLPGNFRLYAALGFAAMLGALAYGILIRQLKMHPLPASALALISLGCVAAAYVGFFTLAHGHALGRWWLAVLWWYAFSSGLWYFDRVLLRFHPMQIHQGGCLCSAIRFRISGEPIFSCVCHCATCRRASAAPTVAWLTFDRGQVEILTGEPRLYRSSQGVVRQFCGTCGSQISYECAVSPATIDITTASLDNPNLFPPTLEVWLEHRVSWESPDQNRTHYPRSTR